MLKRLWLGPEDRWWAPYLGVLLRAAVAGLLVLLFVVLNAGEIARTLRTSGL